MRNHPKYDGEIPDNILDAMHEELAAKAKRPLNLYEYDGKGYWVEETMPWLQAQVSDVGVTFRPIYDVPMPGERLGVHLKPSGFGSNTSKR